MSETRTDVKGVRRQGNWRHRENRASPKYVSKRITEQDHAALTKYAEDHDVKIAELLTPYVQQLLERAHSYCDGLNGAEAKAS